KLFDRALTLDCLGAEVRAALRFASLDAPKLRRQQRPTRRRGPAEPAPRRNPARGGPSRPIILVVAFGESVHTARWLNMVRQSGFRFVLCPVYAAPASKDLPDVHPVKSLADLQALPDTAI